MSYCINDLKLMMLALFSLKEIRDLLLSHRRSLLNTVDLCFRYCKNNHVDARLLYVKCLIDDNYVVTLSKVCGSPTLTML